MADHLGMSIPSVNLWKNRKTVTPRQLAELVYRANRAGADNFQANAIKPLVEFFRIERSDSRHGVRFEVFSEKEDDGRDHPYRAGLKDELKAHFGVYVFFDSRGQAIYAGKARRQTLWKEINLAFNRDRGEVQKIKRVRHPARRQEYRTSEEKARQISEYIVPLHELAAYFSAYQVLDSMIADVEALLVRSFANDLLNIRTERFVRNRA
ncbi:MAG: hypothetical protein ABIR29_03865 [Chthoniobacterales bacterium]